MVTTYGFNLGFKGSYVNYYLANTVVLVPAYADANDTQARNLVQQLYPTARRSPSTCATSTATAPWSTA